MDNIVMLELENSLLKDKIKELEEEIIQLERKANFGYEVTEYHLELIHELEDLEWGEWGDEGYGNLNRLIEKCKVKYEELNY